MSRGFVPNHAWDGVLETRGDRVWLRRVSPQFKRWKLPQTLENAKWSLARDMAEITLYLLENEGVPAKDFLGGSKDTWNIVSQRLHLSCWKVSRVPQQWQERLALCDRRNEHTSEFQKRVAQSLPDLHSTMHQYQKEGVAFALALKQMGLKGCLIADEMGLGKTMQALAVSKYLFATANSIAKKVAVVVPGFLRANWLSEIKKFNILPCEGVEMLLKLKDEPDATRPGHRITIVSYRWMRDNHALLRGYDLLVFDEAHLLKNAYHTRDRDNSQRYVAAKQLVPHVGFTLMLTGTPAPNCPKELYSLLYLIGALGNMKWAEYAFRYCYRYFSRMFFGWCDDGTSAEQELRHLQEVSCIRRLAKDWLHDLPEEMRTFVTLPLSKGKRELFKLAKEREELLKELQGNGLTDQQRSRCSEKMQRNRTQALVASAKAKNHSFKQYFSQHISDYPFGESTPPFIVFALGVVHETVYGKTSETDKIDIIQRFQTGQVNVLILSLAMSWGLNLQNANICFFAELTWSPGTLAQAEKRIHRQGSTHTKVHYIYLIGEPPAICAEVYRKCLRKSAKIDKTVRAESQSSSQKSPNATSSKKRKFDFL